MNGCIIVPAKTQQILSIYCPNAKPQPGGLLLNCTTKPAPSYRRAFAASQERKAVRSTRNPYDVIDPYDIDCKATDRYDQRIAMRQSIDEQWHFEKQRYELNHIEFVVNNLNLGACAASIEDS
jgi:hypothetical protein